MNLRKYLQTANNISHLFLLLWSIALTNNIQRNNLSHFIGYKRLGHKNYGKLAEGISCNEEYKKQDATTTYYR